MPVIEGAGPIIGCRPVRMASSNAAMSSSGERSVASSASVTGSAAAGIATRVDRRHVPVSMLINRQKDRIETTLASCQQGGFDAGHGENVSRIAEIPPEILNVQVSEPWDRC